MTNKDKQDVIAICNILADKMSDSGKVAVQQIIDAVKDMVENAPYEDTISRAALLEELGEEPFNWNDSPEAFQEERDYQWFRSLIENAPSITPSYNSIKTELKPSEDCIRKLIKEFDYKHPVLFADYMGMFNNHTISEIVDYMWDMHELIEDIEYQLPMEVKE